MPQSDPNQLVTQPVPVLVRRLTIPASIGFLFNTMFNVVDTYYGGLLSTEALAALSLSFPVFFIILATGSGLGTGATAVIANALGRGHTTEARILSAQAISFGVLTAVALTGVGIYASPYLFRLLGADAHYLHLAVSYMNTIFLGTVFFILAYMFNAILNARGDTVSFRNFLIGGCLLNIVLDPWFIFGGVGLPAMGFAGIALATVTIQLLGCAYLGFRVYRCGIVTGRTRREILPRRTCMAVIAAQGFPATLNLFSVGAGVFVITYFFSLFGREAVAAYGIATRIEQILLLPTIGLNIATLTLVAQNNGAGRPDRIRETLRVVLRYGAYVMLCGAAILFLGGHGLMRLFTADPAVARIGAGYLKVAAFILYAYVLLFTYVAALQGVKKPLYALWIGLYRQIAAPVILFYCFTRLWNLGLPSVWWGIFGITWSAAVFTVIYGRRCLPGR